MKLITKIMVVVTGLFVSAIGSADGFGCKFGYLTPGHNSTVIQQTEKRIAVEPYDGKLKTIQFDDASSTVSIRFTPKTTFINEYCKSGAMNECKEASLEVFYQNKSTGQFGASSASSIKLGVQSSYFPIAIQKVAGVDVDKAYVVCSFANN